MVTIQSPPGQKVVLRNISWDTYESLLADHEDSAAPRFAYDRGTLEIAMLSPEHERYNRLIQLLASFAAAELGMRIYSLGSTTFRREELEQGFEPDSCFYIQNLASVRGKGRIDLRTDPPPDLVVEIDITNPSIPKLPIYAAFGVPEVWRYDGSRLEMLALEGGRYAGSARSRVLPALTARALSDLLGESKEMDDTDWLLRLRAWARDLGGAAGAGTLR